VTVLLVLCLVFLVGALFGGLASESEGLAITVIVTVAITAVLLILVFAWRGAFL
jgi:hypothetical protein